MNRSKRMLARLVAAIVMCVGAATASAQMSLSFSGVETTTKTLTDGTTLVEFPVGTDLTSVMQGVSVSVDGASVSNSSVVPNPASLSLTDDQVVIFYYQGKAYQFHFSEGKYFTAVFFSDPHVAQSTGVTVANMQNYVKNVIAMGTAAGPCFRFDALPNYNPTCDIAFSMGDMDEDSKTDETEFIVAHMGFHAAGIPFITMCGNHDLVPDYWTGDDGTAGYTTTGGKPANATALATVKAQLDSAQLDGITDLKRFTVSTKGEQQAEPWTFTFNGVRFYCGQTYWFQKIYGSSVLWSSWTPTYYAPDGVISALETFVSEHTDEPSVWMQHYPFVAGSDCNRWWLDQTDVGRYIKTSDTSSYGTSDDVDIYTESSAIAVATAKKDKLASIINKTKNPVHFSGHTHAYATNTYSGITDYTVANSVSDGAAYIVLMKGNKGVVEVKQATFNLTGGSIDDRQNTETEFDGTTDYTDNAVLAGLVSGLQNLSSTDFASGISTAKSAATTDAVSSAISTLDDAFGEYIGTQTSVDVSALLGDNRDFSTAQGTVNSVLSNCYPQASWNTHVRTACTSNNTGYIHLRTNDSNNAAGTTPEVYLRAKWQSVAATEQLLKQAVLPTGTYTLSINTKLVASPTTNLCYYELNGEKTYFTPGSTGAAQTFDIAVSEPTLLTVSLGFIGGNGTTENGLYADNLTLTCTGTAYEHPYWTALAAAQAVAAAGNAAQAAVDQYEWTADELAAQDDETVEKAIAVLNNGTTISSNGEVATSLLANADFSSQTTDKNCRTGSTGGYPAGWTFTYTLDGWKDCFVENNVFNAWAGTITQAELYQALSNLPNGAYRLTADVKTNASDPAASALATYLNAGWPTIGRSEECYAKTNSNTFETYTCAADVANNTLTVGIRSDNAYYQLKNLVLTYLGPTADHEGETDASYFQQDYFWSWRSNYQVDATGDKYKNAEGAIVHPLAANQLIKAAKTNAFADMTNKVVDGTCTLLSLTDKANLNITDTIGAFTATSATYTRAMSNTWGTVILPYAVESSDAVQFYKLIKLTTEETASEDEEATEKMIFQTIDEAPANTPVAFQKLASDATSVTLAAADASVLLTTAEHGDLTSASGWAAQGYYLAQSISDYDGYYYIASDQFWAADGTLTIYPFRTTFTGTTESGVKSLSIGVGTGEETAIQAVESDAKASAIYDLQGRRVSRMGKGIYIMNGKKIFVK